MQDYELIIDDLENKIFLLREEKDRDTILIELLLYYAETWSKRLDFSRRKEEGEISS